MQWELRRAQPVCGVFAGADLARRGGVHLRAIPGIAVGSGNYSRISTDLSSV